MQDRVAVVLFNLGGPDSLAAVQPFLYNLFSDPDIFRLPLGFLTQKPFAALVSRRRAAEASRGYAAIGGASPLLANTRKQAQRLAEVLAGDFEVHICMRYWHPRAVEVVRQLRESGVKRLVLLPLYPQYSGTTTGSSRHEFERECVRQRYQPTTVWINDWYAQSDYIDGIVRALQNELAHFPRQTRDQVEILFSAHGLPRKIIDAGDPYERQIQATFETVCARLGHKRTTLCYQSRVGPLEWLRPYTEDVIRAKARGGAKQMLVYPIAFVSDHVETLYELGQTYAELARDEGVIHYRVAPALNDDPLLIRGLYRLVMDAVTRL